MTEKETFLKMINEHPVVVRYRELEAVINKNETLKQKFDKLKKTQKQLINAEKIEKVTLIESAKKQYEQQLREIESYPLVSEYLALQTDINDMIQQVLFVFENGFINEDVE